jgi:hypothetical protein
MVAQERGPALSPMGSRGSCAAHVPLDRSLRDADAQFQELTANALGSPEPVVISHSPNQRDGRRRNARLSGLVAAAGAPFPKESESFTMPAKDGLGAHEQDGLRPGAHEACEQYEEAALVRAKGRSRHAAGRHNELLTQQSVLGDQLRARSKEVPEKSSDQGTWTGHRTETRSMTLAMAVRCSLA